MNWTESFDLREAVTEYADGAPIASIEIVVPPLYSEIVSNTGHTLVVHTAYTLTNNLLDALSFVLVDVNGKRSATTNLALDISPLIIIPIPPPAQQN